LYKKPGKALFCFFVLCFLFSLNKGAGIWVTEPGPKKEIQSKITPRYISTKNIESFRKRKEFNYKEEKQILGPLDNFFIWLNNLFFYGYGNPKSYRIQNIIITLCVVGILVFAISKIFGLDKMGLFQRRDLQNYRGEMELPGLDNEKNWDQLIKQSINQENYPEAIRYWYFKTLHVLNQRGWIAWRIWKTNQNYLREMETKEGFLAFRKLTYYYEYSYYGGFQVDHQQFLEIEKVFQAFNSEKRSL
jgi:hypothetical protein